MNSSTACSRYRVLHLLKRNVLPTTRQGKNTTSTRSTTAATSICWQQPRRRGIDVAGLMMAASSTYRQRLSRHPKGNSRHRRIRGAAQAARREQLRVAADEARRLVRLRRHAGSAEAGDPCITGGGTSLLDRLTYLRGRGLAEDPPCHVESSLLRVRSPKDGCRGISRCPRNR